MLLPVLVEPTAEPFGAPVATVPSDFEFPEPPGEPLAPEPPAAEPLMPGVELSMVVLLANPALADVSAWSNALSALAKAIWAAWTAF